jgi:dephospho-CoA kinase
MHPAINEYMRRWSGNILGKNDKARLIYHAPLLIEAMTETTQYDYIILIYCSEATQLDRLRKRGYPPYDDALALMAKQMPYAQKLEYADFVLDNDSTEANAEAEVARIDKVLRML